MQKLKLPEGIYTTEFGAKQNTYKLKNKVNEIIEAINDIMGVEESTDDNIELGNEVDYWKSRCLAAENFIKESPCDSNITEAQREAHSEWLFFIKEN